MEPFEGGPGKLGSEEEHEVTPHASSGWRSAGFVTLFAFALLSIVAMLVIVASGGNIVWLESDGIFPGWLIATLPFIAASFACCWKYVKELSFPMAATLSKGALILLGFSIIALSAISVVISFSICTYAVFY